MDILTQEMIEQAKQDGTACYDWGRNFKNKNVYDLYLTIKKSVIFKRSRKVRIVNEITNYNESVFKPCYATLLE